MIRAEPAALHPDTRAYLADMSALMAKMKLPPLWTVELARRRALNKMLIASSKPPLAPCDLVEDVQIPTRAGPRRGRVYRGVPAGTADLPVVVYHHGGGFAIGGIDESDHECRRYAAATPALVVAIEYRKSPEHPYPASEEDCYDALLWAADRAASYGGNPARIVLAGVSAGAGAATATALRALERGGPRIALVAAVTPWYDKTLSQPSMQTYGSGFHLDREEVEHYRDLLLPAGAAGADRYNSPALFPAPAGLAPHYLLVAECDAVADDSYVFAERLAAAGVPYELVLAKGLIHAFTLLAHLIPAADPYLDGLHAAIRNA
ncbi:MAG: acetyl esterase [Candidatus Eremiobacteraeota bacterium]|nr:acetyl esterase [Candidatus Eremiobacteraeota bacterium]